MCLIDVFLLGGFLCLDQVDANIFRCGISLMNDVKTFLDSKFIAVPLLEPKEEVALGV